MTVARPAPGEVQQAVRRAGARSPLAALMRDPHRFEFFQAVRLIELAAAEERRSGQARPRPFPYEEYLRFRAEVGFGFPANTVTACASAADASADEADPPPEGAPVATMTVSFLGLAGTGGVLPWHYTQLLIDTVREKDFRLRDFLDLLNHRAIAQFYRAWRKSRFFIGYEAARREPGAEADRFTKMLFGLVGLGTPGLQRRLAVPDDVFLYYAGHFSHRPRSAVALQQIVSDLFRLPTEVEQFRGQWMELRSGDQTSLRGRSNNQLGASAVVGARVWSIEHAVRVRLRVRRLSTFQQFLPGAAGHAAVHDVVRSYLGPAYDFDVQIVLTKEEVPPCEMTAAGAVQLGWNTWLFSGKATRDVDDAVFAHDVPPDRATLQA